MKLKIMLIQTSTELELELGLNLTITRIHLMKMIVQSNSMPSPAHLARFSSVEGMSSKSLFLLEQIILYTKKL